MTVSKVHHLLEVYIENKHKIISNILDPTKSWNSKENLVKEFSKFLAEILDTDLQWLEAIRKQLPPKTRCKHPINMRDRCGRQWYCMSCNEDLDEKLGSEKIKSISTLEKL